jgi:hypothetical protein
VVRLVMVVRLGNVLISHQTQRLSFPLLVCLTVCWSAVAAEMLAVAVAVVAVK